MVRFRAICIIQVSSARMRDHRAIRPRPSLRIRRGVEVRPLTTGKNRKNRRSPRASASSACTRAKSITQMTRFAAALLFALSVAPAGVSAQTLTITHATVVDVSNGALRRGWTVVVDGNRIVRAGPASAATAPRGQVIDVKGMYVMPGLWDMHTHAYFGWT